MSIPDLQSQLGVLKALLKSEEERLEVTKSLLKFQKALLLSEANRVTVARQLLLQQLQDRQEARARLDKDLSSLASLLSEQSDPVKATVLQARGAQGRKQIEELDKDIAEILKERDLVEKTSADTMQQIAATRTNLSRQVSAALAEVSELSAATSRLVLQSSQGGRPNQEIVSNAQQISDRFRELRRGYEDAARDLESQGMNQPPPPPMPSGGMRRASPRAPGSSNDTNPEVIEMKRRVAVLEDQLKQKELQLNSNMGGQQPNFFSVEEERNKNSAPQQQQQPRRGDTAYSRMTATPTPLVGNRPGDMYGNVPPSALILRIRELEVENRSLQMELANLRNGGVGGGDAVASSLAAEVATLRSTLRELEARDKPRAQLASELAEAKQEAMRLRDQLKGKGGGGGGSSAAASSDVLQTRLREFTVNTQTQLERRVASANSETAIAQEQLEQLQKDLVNRTTEYQREIMRLRSIVAQVAPQQVNPKPGSAPRLDTARANDLFARGPPVPGIPRSAPPTREAQGRDPNAPPLTAAWPEYANNAGQPPPSQGGMSVAGSQREGGVLSQYTSRAPSQASRR